MSMDLRIKSVSLKEDLNDRPHPPPFIYFIFLIKEKVGNPRVCHIFFLFC